MSKLLHGETPDGTKRLLFFCPGCNYYHQVTVDPSPGYAGPSWTWNGDDANPTIEPSVMVNQGAHNQCHLFVKEGRIEYLSDSHHALAGQTVEMKEED